jgi:hypothetical protein
MAVYEVKDQSDEPIENKVVVRRETITQESVQEITLNQLEEQLNFAKQRILEEQARVKQIEDEIVKVKEVLGIK